MKALVLEDVKQFAYRDVPDPEISADEVLIQVKATGICGSDIHGMDGSSGRRIPPIIMGHESAGVITKVGEHVKDWQVGERVTFDSTIYCGECHFCRRGEINLCDNRRVVGVSCGDYRQHGAFAEYLAVPSRILYRIPENLSFVQAAFVEPVTIAVHAVERTPIAMNDTAVVVGTGLIGLLLIQVLKQSGCGRIIGVDVDDSRLALARDFGADVTLNSKTDDVVNRIMSETDGRGADIAFEVVGITPTVQIAVNSLRKGGSLTLVGNISAFAELPIQNVVTRELSLYGSCSSQGEYPVSLAMLAQGKIQVDSLITEVAPLSDGAVWFDRLYNEQGLLKVLLVPDGGDS
ncbi:MAG: galactitol-1-phosphate 5-dehydrogenase [Aggregatilineales bacterium]